MPKKKRPNAEPCLAKLESVRYRMTVRESDSEKSSSITLPFIPFVGLNVCVPHRKGDYAPLIDIFWNDVMGEFEVFIESEEEVKP